MNGDLKLSFPDVANGVLGYADISVTGYEVAEDNGLENAIVIALFTDRRADDSDILPDKNDMRGGHFISQLEGFNLGSKLWLLRRNNLDQNTLDTAQKYLQEAFNEQIVSNGIAKSGDIEVTRDGREMKILVTVYGESDNKQFFRYSVNWENQMSRL